MLSHDKTHGSHDDQTTIMAKLQRELTMATIHTIATKTVFKTLIKTTITPSLYLKSLLRTESGYHHR